MIAAFRKWRAERAASRNLTMYLTGYNWAAGALLRGALEDYTSSYTDNPFDRNEFDYGAQEAMRDFAALRREVKP